MQTSSNLKRTLVLMGVDPSTGKRNMKVPLFVFAFFTLVVNTVYYIIENWDNVDRRIHGIQAIFFHVITGSQALTFIFNWKNVILLIRVLDQSHYPFPFRISAERRNLLSTTESQMNAISVFWYQAINICAVIGVGIPVLLFIKKIFGNISGILIDDLELLFPVYYPNDYELIITYFVAYILQSIFYVGAAYYGYVTLAGSLLSMHLAAGELKLLCLSIKEMDESIYSKKYIGMNRNTYNDDTYMREFFKYFVKHQLSIYSKLQDINRGIRVIGFCINFGVSIYVCLGLFTFVKTDDPFVKLQEIAFCSLWSIDIFCYDFMGENIATENDNVLIALYSSPWIDKPKWFRKSLQVVMARTQKPIEINPVGMFVLNLKNYAKFVNAAYSYFNLLNSST